VSSNLGRPGLTPERLLVEVAVPGAHDHARPVAGSDERVPGSRRAVHEVPGPEMPLFLLDDRDALAGHDEEVLLDGLGVEPRGRLPGRHHADDEARPGLDVLLEIRPATQDELVGLEDADTATAVVVHPRGVAGVDDEPAWAYRSKTRGHGFETRFFNHEELLPQISESRRARPP